MKILVVAPSWIGDTLMAQPLLALLAARPASVDVLAPGWSAPLLGRMAEIGNILESPFGHGDFAFMARRALGKRLAAAGYDEAIVLPNSWKSALAPFFAGIPQRTGYIGESRYGLLNNRHRLDKAGVPRLVDRYARLAVAPDAPTPALPATRLNSSPEQQQAARSALNLPQQGAPVVFCPGAEYGPAKRWPARHFAALASRIASPEAPVWILGGPKDATAGDEIVRLSKNCAINLCGRTTLIQAIDLLACARQVVSNDSGLMHVAAALGRPLIALYGSSSPGYTPPLSSSAKILSLNLPCSPCFKRECPLGHLDCLEKLAPEKVQAEMEER
ncbi:MAG TPA: lipopolysaccharide heptosyltransferase II [Rhodocyclaceae bacterium]